MRRLFHFVQEDGKVGDERECTELGQMETAPFPCSAQRGEGEEEILVYFCSVALALS